MSFYNSHPLHESLMCKIWGFCHFFPDSLDSRTIGGLRERKFADDADGKETCKSTNCRLWTQLSNEGCVLESVQILIMHKAFLKSISIAENRNIPQFPGKNLIIFCSNNNKNFKVAGFWLSLQRCETHSVLKLWQNSLLFISHIFLLWKLKQSFESLGRNDNIY